MSLAEIEKAIDQLPPKELTKLAAHIARRDKLAWDKELEEDFRPGGKHEKALEKIDAEIDSGNFTPLLASHALKSFCKCYDQLPARIRKLAE
jgi:hypothetical protein